MSRRLASVFLAMLVLTAAMGLKTAVSSGHNVLMANGGAPLPQPPKDGWKNGGAPLPQPPKGGWKKAGAAEVVLQP